MRRICLLILLCCFMISGCGLGSIIPGNNIIGGTAQPSLAPDYVPTAKPAPKPSPSAAPAASIVAVELPAPAPSPAPEPEPDSDDAVRSPDFSELAPTVNMSFEELIGDDGLRDYPKGYPAADTYYIIVDVTHQVTMVYTKDINGEYTVPVRYMLCSTGIGDRTPIGKFKMQAYRVRFSQFARDGRYGQYWSQIRNAIYFHTTLYTKKDVASYEEESYSELGNKASHGCIRLTIPDARWIWYNAAYGTMCEIRQGDSNDLATAMIREQLILADVPNGRIDVTAGGSPDTDNWSIEDVETDIPFKQGSQGG